MNALSHSSQVETLRANVERNGDVDQSLAALIEGIIQQFKACAGDVQKTNALATELTGQIATLGTAVRANTPIRDAQKPNYPGAPGYDPSKEHTVTGNVPGAPGYDASKPSTVPDARPEKNPASHTEQLREP